MAKFSVAIARTRSERAELVVEAETAEDAQQQVERVMEGSDEAYCALVNGVRWRGDEDSFDDRVVDVTEVK